MGIIRQEGTRGILQERPHENVLKAFEMVCASRYLDAPKDLEHFTREWLNGQRESIDNYLYSLGDRFSGNEIEFQRRKYQAALKEAELALMVVEEWRANQAVNRPTAEELNEAMITDLSPKRYQKETEELIQKYGFFNVVNNFKN